MGRDDRINFTGCEGIDQCLSIILIAEGWIDLAVGQVIADVGFVEEEVMGGNTDLDFDAAAPGLTDDVEAARG